MTPHVPALMTPCDGRRTAISQRFPTSNTHPHDETQSPKEKVLKISFDKEMDRRGVHSIKWEFVREGKVLRHGDHADPRHGAERVLPMWVADMDFDPPPAVVEAVVARAENGFFGYCRPTDSYFEAVIAWIKRQHGWSVERDWIVTSPGVVAALSMLVQSCTSRDDKILIQPPVYHPFFHVIENNGRQIVSNSLLYERGRYHMDFDDLALKASDPAVKMAFLCSPHNPVGRVWTAGELARFGEICLENGVLVVSDEIHADLIYQGYAFTAFAGISEAFLSNSVTCTAASKSFNLAGLKTSNIIIPDEGLREAFSRELERNGMYGANPFGIVATEAAYDHGEAWLGAAMEYVEGNYRYLVDYVARQLPQIKVALAEGTYLVWLDFRELGLSPAERRELLLNRARVLLEEGEIFGREGEGFERINIACPRSILVEAMERIRAAVSGLSWAPGDGESR
jgi:cystathionine beta-lyase